MTGLDSRVVAFYQPPNEVDLAGLADEATGLVDDLAARLAVGKRTLLPAMATGMTRWYGFAPDARESRLLDEELQAWLAPPIGARPVRVGSEIGDDAVDIAACRIAPDGVLLRIDVAKAWRSDARANVRSLVDLWATAPVRQSDVPRPVGRVLREFYEALGARDRAAAQTAVEEIRSRGLLSAANVVFLRVQLIGTLGSPGEMRDDSELGGVSSLSRPPAVTGHLAEAADALFIAPHLDPDKGSEVAWEAVAVAVEDVWPGLVSHPSQIGSAASARCLALAESLTAAPRRVVYDALQAEWSADSVVAAVLKRLRGDTPGLDD